MGLFDFISGIFGRGTTTVLPNGSGGFNSFGPGGQTTTILPNGSGGFNTFGSGGNSNPFGGGSNWP